MRRRNNYSRIGKNNFHSRSARKAIRKGYARGIIGSARSIGTHRPFWEKSGHLM